MKYHHLIIYIAPSRYLLPPSPPWSLLQPLPHLLPRHLRPIAMLAKLTFVVDISFKLTSTLSIALRRMRPLAYACHQRLKCCNTPSRFLGTSCRKTMLSFLRGYVLPRLCSFKALVRSRHVCAEVGKIPEQEK